MKILTIDTAADKMFVTIGENGQAELSRIVENTSQRYHSALLIPVIIELLKEKNLTMKDIDAVGVNIGPGSFTGIRATATVARVIGQSLNIPVVGVSSLEIFSLLNNTGKNTLCLLDAKKGKSYMAVYDSENNPVIKPSALDYEEVIHYAQNNDLCIITDRIMGEKIKNAGLHCINWQDIDCNFGIYLARLTYKHLLSDKKEEHKWYNLKPLYIQPPPITMSKSIKKM